MVESSIERAIKDGYMLDKTIATILLEHQLSEI